jgi:hypothetical protein
MQENLPRSLVYPLLYKPIRIDDRSFNKVINQLETCYFLVRQSFD